MQVKERGGLRRMHPPLCEAAAERRRGAKNGSGSDCGIGTAPRWDGREAIEEHQESAGDPVVRLKCRSERTGDGVPAWRNAPAFVRPLSLSGLRGKTSARNRGFDY